MANAVYLLGGLHFFHLSHPESLTDRHCARLKQKTHYHTQQHSLYHVYTTFIINLVLSLLGVVTFCYACSLLFLSLSPMCLLFAISHHPMFFGLDSHWIWFHTVLLSNSWQFAVVIWETVEFDVIHFVLTEYRPARYIEVLINRHSTTAAEEV